MANLSNTGGISWQAPEFKYYPKNLGWYITVFAVTVLVSGFFVIVESDIFAATSLGLVGLLILLFARHQPKQVKITIDERGVQFDKLFYPYKQIRHFWIVNNPRHRTINFQTSALFNNIVILELEQQNPETVRQLLIKHVPEHEATEETAVQKIIHRFKF